MSADIQRKSHGEANGRIVDAVCRASGPAIEWLADKHGVPFQLVEGFLYPGHSVERMHCVPQKTGAALMACLLNACKDVDILTSAKVTAVTPDIVRFERPDGTTEQVRKAIAYIHTGGKMGERPDDGLMQEVAIATKTTDVDQRRLGMSTWCETQKGKLAGFIRAKN